MFTRLTASLALTLVLVSAPVLAQTEAPPPPPVDGGAAPDAGIPTPPMPEAGGAPMPPIHGGMSAGLPEGHPPIKSRKGGDHGRDGMAPPPPARTMIRITLYKDRTLEIGCGEDNIAACVTAAMPVLDRFLD